jgi:hypothetical protein
MGSTYIVVSNVHLLDHDCGFATVGGLVGVLISRSWLRGDLESTSGKIIKARVSNHFSCVARECHVKGGPSPR